MPKRERKRFKMDIDEDAAKKVGTGRPRSRKGTSVQNSVEIDEDIQRYRDMLPYDQDNPDDDYQQYAQHYADIGFHMARAASRRDYLKDRIKSVEGAVATRIRKKSEVKLTVKDVDALTTSDQEYLDAVQAYHSALAVYNDWDRMMAAWRQKGYSMRATVDLIVARMRISDTIRN